MANNPRAKDNLQPAKKGEVRNPNGRPKKLKNVVKALPKDMQERILAILGFAMSLPDEDSAREYLEYRKGELGEYGIVLQIAIKQMLKDGFGFNAMMDMMDRIYGKPKNNLSVESTGEGVTIVVNSKAEKDRIDKMKKLDI